jgi:hypothetical protein
MNPEERLSRVEALVEKQNDGIRALIVVGRTCLDSIQELREVQREDHKHMMVEIGKLREAQSATDDKLHILIDTVDRIIRRDQ